MFCKKCGATLGSKSYICPSCGTLMSKDQIEMLKEINKNNDIKQPVYLSSLFGVKRDIKYREDNSYNNTVLFIIGFIFILLLIILLFIL